MTLVKIAAVSCRLASGRGDAQAYRPSREDHRALRARRQPRRDRAHRRRIDVEASRAAFRGRESRAGRVARSGRKWWPSRRPRLHAGRRHHGHHDREPAPHSEPALFAQGFRVHRRHGGDAAAARGHGEQSPQGFQELPCVREGESGKVTSPTRANGTTNHIAISAQDALKGTSTSFPTRARARR